MINNNAINNIIPEVFEPVNTGKFAHIPVTEGKLRELYRKEGKSAREIGIIVAGITGRDKPYTDQCIYGWFKLFGIRRRSQKDACVAYGSIYKAVKASLLSPNKRVATPEEMAAMRQRVNTKCPEHRRKMSDAAKQREAKRKVYTICLECNKKFSRKPSKLRAYENNFCGNSCSARYTRKKQREKRLIESSKTGIVVGYAITTCNFCKKEYQDTKIRIGKAKYHGRTPYCSDTCRKSRFRESRKTSATGEAL
jgi:hypothetical protein